MLAHGQGNFRHDLVRANVAARPVCSAHNVVIWLTTGLNAIAVLATLIIAAVIVWRKSDDWMGIFTSLTVGSSKDWHQNPPIVVICR